MRQNTNYQRVGERRVGNRQRKADGEVVYFLYSNVTPAGIERRTGIGIFNKTECKEYIVGGNRHAILPCGMRLKRDGVYLAACIYLPVLRELPYKIVFFIVG